MSLRDLAPLYDAFLIDQFGVLHDGARLYPGAAEAMVALKGMGKRIALLSNSGRRAAYNADRITRLGLPRESWDAFVTSGEVAFGLIRDGALPGIGPGARCHLLSREDDTSPTDGLGLIAVDRPQDADFLLISGAEPEKYSLDACKARLAPAAALGIPAVCSNPDLRILVHGTLGYGPGAIAQAYEAAGGPVTWIGKPHAILYDTALTLLGATDRSRAVGIGDSMIHDIAGAKGAGLAAIYVSEGVYAGERGAGPEPDHVIARFVW